MKICPICDTTYDEDVIRFCTKDGTPLVDNAEPNFVQLPSEDLDEPEDDIGEITIIRRKDVPAPPPPIDESSSDSPRLSERIVIPTIDQPPPVQNVRPRQAQVYYPPIEKPNTIKVVALTVFGTVVLLGLGAGLFWALQSDKPSNGNVNLNTNLGAFNGNLNSNSNVNPGFDFNLNGTFPSNYNVNGNVNANANIKTPTPTPKPSPSVTPSPTPDDSPDATPTRTPAPGTPRPTPSATPREGPRPTPNPSRTPGR